MAQKWETSERGNFFEQNEKIFKKGFRVLPDK